MAFPPNFKPNSKKKASPAPPMGPPKPSKPSKFGKAEFQKMVAAGAARAAVKK